MGAFIGDIGISGTRTITFRNCHARGITGKNDAALNNIYGRKNSKITVVTENCSVNSPAEDDDSGEAVESPEIVWSGYDITERHTYTSSMTFVLDITANEGVSDCVLKTDSEVLSEEELKSIGLSPEISLVNGSEYFMSLQKLGIPYGDSVKDQKSVQLDFTPFMSLISGIPGDYDFEIIVTDNMGVTVTQTVKLQVN